MKLKLVAEQTGQSWTLKPKRDYIIGSDSDCDINIERPDVVSSKHLKISFNPTINTWYLYDLGSATGTFVNQQRVNDCPINSQTRIGLGNNYFLTAAPELATVAQASTAHNSTFTNDGYGHNSYNNGLNGGTTAYQQPSHRNNLSSSSLKVLSWKKFVKQQIEKESSLIDRFSTWFAMITGFRKLEWIINDSYIIPDFKGSKDRVLFEIQNQVSTLAKYQDTDCYTSQLTDAHICDDFHNSGAGFFPIKRGVGKNKKSDYRDFTVTSYNRVRNYLLVEEYGTDLFISWITRFEPEAESTSITSSLGIILLIDLILIIASAASDGFGGFIAGLFWAAYLIFFWCQIFVLAPLVMVFLKILPKKQNAWVVMGIVSFPMNLSILIAWIFYTLGGKVAKTDLPQPNFNLNSMPATTPPLDTFDARKLDQTVSHQVEKALKPILQSEGRNQEQIEQILTRTSLGGSSFKR
jgi:hypothetical protein